MPPRRQNLPKHILANSMPIPFAGCWVWMLACNPDGYGNIWINGKDTNAHRAAWLAFRGPIPAGLLVCHSCDIRSCVNPDHLWLGTHADNMRDMYAKKRHGAQRVALGATFIARINKWQAQKWINGKQTYLGVYPTAAEASAAYHAA